jgi:hypothetical protein
MQLSKRLVAALTATLAVILMAAMASAGGAEVTRGDFEAFAGGIGTYDGLAGNAQMVRTASGQTIVTVTVTGLQAGATYLSHVHAQSCADGDAGGHYSFGFPVPGGAHASGSEIWPGPFTANPAGNAQGKATVEAVAGPAAVSVVIHALEGTKIACADLA